MDVTMICAGVGWVPAMVAVSLIGASLMAYIWAALTGAVTVYAPYIRSYTVVTEDGREFMRNRVDLKKQKEVVSTMPKQSNSASLRRSMESHPVRQEATGAQRALTGADTPSMNGRSHAAARELCAPPWHLESPTASLPVVGEREYADRLRVTPPIDQRECLVQQSLVSRPRNKQKSNQMCESQERHRLLRSIVIHLRARLQWMVQNPAGGRQGSEDLPAV
ncbi:hypothetical protein HPB50_006124 [Hyalomma asiaticum]|uniref:Uncharacterized protein n=1 Tax=Hyalomma asiaticum TaxID=266040 RepID=A0ACB7SND0_HYAAI|nr:hypothetical protein HPB50_006124 [Hyalomma asiaticum]